MKPFRAELLHTLQKIYHREPSRQFKMNWTASTRHIVKLYEENIKIKSPSDI